jgi:hypothetical protein
MKRKLLVRPLVSAVFESLHNKLFNYMQRAGLVLSAAHTSVASHTDAIYSISATLPETYDASGYESTDLIWTAIGKVSDFLPYGSKRNVNEWVPIAGAVEYTKGAPRYGSGDMMMGDVPADAGQVILKAAEASANHYSFKVVYPDGETHYLDGIVSAWTLSGGKEGAPMVRTATISICAQPVIVAAS